MELVGYSHGDLERLAHPVGIDAATIEVSSRVLSEMEATRAAHCGRTLFDRGEPIACFGVWPLTSARGAAWSVLTAEALRVPKTLFKAVKRSLDAFAAENGLSRIEAVGNAENPALDGWFRHLGFERETNDGGMRRYDGHDTFHLWARVY